MSESESYVKQKRAKGSKINTHRHREVYKEELRRRFFPPQQASITKATMIKKAKPWK